MANNYGLYIVINIVSKAFQQIRNQFTDNGERSKEENIVLPSLQNHKLIVNDIYIYVYATKLLC